MPIFRAVCDCMFVTLIIGDIRRGKRKTKNGLFLLYHIILFEALVKTKNGAFLWAS